MATPTYDLISETELTASASQIDFTSLPTSTYGIFVIEINYQTDTTTQCSIRINNSSGVATYEWRFRWSRGSIYNNNLFTTDDKIRFADQGSTFDETKNAKLTFINLGNTSEYKGVLTKAADRWFNSDGVGFWKDYAAATSIQLFPNSGNFTTGTTARLFGLVQ